MKKKYFVVGFLILFFVAITSSLAIIGEVNAKEQDKTTLSLWYWGQPEQIFGGLISRFEEKNPNVKVKLRGIKSSEYSSVLSISLQGGKGPDVFCSKPNPMVNDYAEAGFIIPLEEKVPILEKYPEAAKAGTSYEGTVYAVPSTVQTLQIFYNKKIFSKYNLQEPDTWEEFENIAETLQSNGVTPFCVPGASTWALTNGIQEIIGASFLRNEWTQKLVQGKVDYTDEKFIKSLELVLSLKPYFIEGFQSVNYNSQTTLFASGECAMTFDGIWEPPYYIDANPELKGNVGMFLGPPMKESQGPLVYSFLDGGWAVNAETSGDVRDAAISWVNFVAGKEAGRILAEDGSLLTYAPGVTLDEDLPLLKEAKNNLVERPLSPTYGKSSKFDFQSPTVFSLMNEAMQGLLLEKITPEEAAKRIQKGVDRQEK